MQFIVIQHNDSGAIDLRKTFVMQLDRLLPLKGYTAARLAAETGISVNTLSVFRNGKRNMNTKTFETVLNHLINQPDAKKN